MHCGATSGHTANCYLDIAGDQINYEAYTGSYLVFEQANETEGQWYIKDVRSNKYLVVANLAADTQVTLSNEASTYWTTSDRAADSGSKEGIRFMPNGNTGFYLNNNGGFHIKSSGANGGCSTWVLEEVAAIPTIESGWYSIQIDYGKNGYHNGKNGWYVSGRAPIKTGNNTWGMRLSKDIDPTCYVYVTKGDGDNNYTFEFMKGQTGAVTMGYDCQTTSANKNITLIPTSAGETIKWKIWGNGVQKWRGWELYNVASLGSASASNAENNYNYFTFTSLGENPNFNPSLPFESASSVPTMNTTKWYNLTVKGQFLVYDAANNKFTYSNTKPTPDNKNGLFAFVGNQLNGYKIFNYGAGKAFGVNTIATDQVVTGVSESEAHTYIFHEFTLNNAPCYQFEDAAKQDAYLNHLNAGLGYWVASAYGDNGNKITIEEVEDVTDIVAVEYTMHDETGDVADYVVLKFQSNASEFSTEVPSGCTFVSQTGSGTVSPSNRTTTVTYTSVQLPFTPGLVYRLGVRPSGGNAVRYCGYRHSDGKPLAEQNNDDEPCNEFAAENLWVFERVAGSANQFKLKNLGANAYLAGNGFNATGTAYTYATTTVDMGNINASGFTLANGSAALGNHAGGENYENHQLGEWTDNGAFNDAGSVFWVEDITSEIPNLTNVGLSRSTFLGVKQHPVNASAKEAAAETPNETNVKALFNVNFTDYATSGKYYRFVNYDRNTNCAVTALTYANANGVIPNETANTRLVVASDNVKNVTSVWQFEEENGSYRVKHVNSGCYLTGSTNNNANVDLPIEKQWSGTYDPSSIEGKWWCIKRNGVNEWVHASNHTDKKLLLWDGTPSLTDTQASVWSIEEVTKIPVTIGAAGYSTFCAPMNVMIPSSVEAYIIKSTNTESATLKQVTGILPAETGVILKNAGTHNFTITNDAATADVDGNLLSGTTIRRQGFGENVNYVLANTNGIGLYLNGTVNAVPANKAYLSATAGMNNVKSFSFSFDEDPIETAIKTLEAEQMAKSAIYDLQGRRVEKAQKGLYIINGKKVMVK